MIDEIVLLLNGIQYGYMDKKHNIHTVVDSSFDKNYILQSKEELLNNKVGVCWDQVELERYLFSDKNISFNTYFIIYYGKKRCQTHTFLIYKLINKYYWFEHAWEKYSGIHVYTSEIEALKDIKEKFLSSTFDKKHDFELGVYRYDAPKSGIDSDRFINHCLNGECIDDIIQNSDKNDLTLNIDRLHTTILSSERIKRNINVECEDVVPYVKTKIIEDECYVYKIGKNYYCRVDNVIFTVNLHNYCIITAHTL